MNIEVLKNLRDNPSDGTFANEPISMQEITMLEQEFNGGNQFPKALRELLFLAGKFCIVFDYGLNDSQQEMQLDARADLPEYNRVVNRPYYIVDVYNAGEQFLFVYLDENQIDPILYEASLPHREYEVRPWVHSLNRTLSQFIQVRLDDVKKGFNPF
ncbi:hypothetical protein [Pedobacter sp.]|uniref:hypothetical protein n=1 Tax=Pedobacter sp. TaxID=1411316 RepID=UPI0031D1CC69